MREGSLRGHAGRHLDEEETLMGDGAVARLADQILENPAKSGGLLVMALTACGIVSNAMFLQSGRHPEPLFMTRPIAALDTPRAKAVPAPRVRAEAAAPAAVTEDMPAQLPEPPAGHALIANIQRGLSRAHLYVGPADGVAGTRTRAAISAFQQSAGRAVDGAPSASLLDDIRAAANARSTAPTPVAKVAPPAAPPVAKVVAAAPATPAPVAKVVAAPLAAAAAAKVAPPAPAARAAAPAPAAAPQPTPAARAAVPDPAAAEHDRLKAVVAALNDIGYGPLKATGQATSETADAVRRFELDNGLPINGTVDDAVVKRLVAIGAMKPI